MTPTRSAAAIALALCAAACGSDGPQPARVVILADTHVIGPQYTTPVENSEADNESILLTPARLRSVRDRVNALEPKPDAVIVLGDVLHAAHHSADVAWYDENPSAFSEARDIFAGFTMPVHVLMGNHDYEMDCAEERYPRALSEALFRRFFGAEPYYTVEYGGARFYLLNGQQGPTWDVTHPLCDTTYPSFGAAQLGWLDDQLADGTPAVVMSHYMGLLWKRNENPDEVGREDLDNVLDAHANVRMYLGGHSHRWLDFNSLYDYEHYVVGPARYDDDNFWILDLDGQGNVTMVDRDKAGWNTSCASTFDYDHEPLGPLEGAVEAGTCVDGLE